MALIEKQKQELQQNEEKKAPLYRAYPDIYKHTNYSEKTIEIEVELPGVKKEDISLKALPTWFKLSATREDRVEYAAQKGFGVEVVPEKTTAKYENGLLKITAHIRDPMDEAKVITF